MYVSIVPTGCHLDILFPMLAAATQRASPAARCSSIGPVWTDH